MIFAAVSKAIVFQKGSLFETIVVCWSSFQRFTNTNTMTVLTGGSQYIYHEGELPDRKPVETHKETRWAVKSLRNMPLRSCSHKKKFENASSFLQLGLTFTLIRHARTELFENALQIGRISIHRLWEGCVISLPVLPSNATPKWPAVFFVVNSSSVVNVVDGKHLMRFQNEASVYKFP